MWSRSNPYVLIFLLTAASTGLTAESPDFNTQVMPVFRKYCNGCHNANDAEGGLVLQDYVRAMKGGENGPAIGAVKARKARFGKG